MRIIVTGASGFMGSHLCRDLVANGHEVAVLSRSREPRRLQDLFGRVTFIEGELSDLAACYGPIAGFTPDAVAHLGWQGVAGRDRDAASQVDNIGWTIDLLELCRQAGARTFLGVGSQAEYGPKSEPIAPDDATRPTTIYGEAKLASARIGARLAEQHDMRFVWMRVFSVFGPDDHPYWMLPSLIGSLLRRERPALTGGDQLWDFLPVADAARAIRLCIETERASGVYNLGSGRAPRLRVTIEAVRDLVDPELALGWGELPYRHDQVMRLQADVSALRRDIGWEPAADLVLALTETVGWYRENRWVFGEGAKP